MRRVLLAFLRIAVGGVFIATGVAKLRGPAAAVKNFEHWGVPAPSTAVYVVAGLEVVCGLLLLLGLAPRLAALVLGLDMLGALATAGRVDHGVYLAVPGALALCCLVLLARGGGRWLLLDAVDPAPTPPRA
jgi:uncharacterized membrane protein YphA (DoxX/SURF4 family)